MSFSHFLYHVMRYIYVCKTKNVTWISHEILWLIFHILLSEINHINASWNICKHTWRKCMLSKIKMVQCNFFNVLSSSGNSSNIDYRNIKKWRLIYFRVRQKTHYLTINLLFIWLLVMYLLENVQCTYLHKWYKTNLKNVAEI